METKVLIVEDEPLIGRDIRFLIEDMGIRRIETVMSYEDAVNVQIINIIVNFNSIISTVRSVQYMC